MVACTCACDELRQWPWRTQLSAAHRAAARCVRGGQSGVSSCATCHQRCDSVGSVLRVLDNRPLVESHDRHRATAQQWASLGGNSRLADSCQSQQAAVRRREQRSARAFNRAVDLDTVVARCLCRTLSSVIAVAIAFTRRSASTLFLLQSSLSRSRLSNTSSCVACFVT